MKVNLTYQNKTVSVIEPVASNTAVFFGQHYNRLGFRVKAVLTKVKDLRRSL